MLRKYYQKNMATEELKNISTSQKEFQSLPDQDFKDRKLKENEIIHIWWHPHNLGFDFNLSIKRLLELIDILKKGIENNDIESKNMIELYQKFKQ